MKVRIGPYKDWFGPYQLAEFLCFWAKEEKDEYGIPRKPNWVHNFGEWLAYGNIEIESETQVGEIRSLNRARRTTWLYRFLSWIHSKRKRTIKVHIDRWDTWNTDETLSHIILPMLIQLKATKHGAPQVDHEDVPEELRPTEKAIAAYNKDGTTDEHFFERWDWIMGEMIFAFESKLDDSWEEQFEFGESDLQWKKLENGMSEMVEGPNHTKVYDSEGRKKYSERIENGFRLFGKYYQSLWDQRGLEDEEHLDYCDDDFCYVSTNQKWISLGNSARRDFMSST